MTTVYKGGNEKLVKEIQGRIVNGINKYIFKLLCLVKKINFKKKIIISRIIRETCTNTDLTSSENLHQNETGGNRSHKVFEEIINIWT